MSHARTILKFDDDISHRQLLLSSGHSHTNIGRSLTTPGHYFGLEVLPAGLISVPRPQSHEFGRSEAVWATIAAEPPRVTDSKAPSKTFPL